MSRTHPRRAPMNIEPMFRLKFSVITVCRDAADTIERAVLSVRAQDYPLVEHIVVDGASTDDTAARAASVLRKGGTVISEPDDGIYNAMNKGWRRAAGSVIAFLNADDFYAHSSVLSDVARVFESDGPDAVFGDIAFFSKDDLTTLGRRYRSDRFRPSRLRWGWMPAHPGMFVLRTVYEAVGGFREDYAIAGDFEFVARAFGRGERQFLHLAQVLVHMQRGGTSTQDWRARMTINRETVRACRANGIYTNLPMVMTKYPLKLLELLS